MTNKHFSFPQRRCFDCEKAANLRCLGNRTKILATHDSACEASASHQQCHQSAELQDARSSRVHEADRQRHSSPDSHKIFAALRKTKNSEVRAEKVQATRLGHLDQNEIVAFQAIVEKARPQDLSAPPARLLQRQAELDAGLHGHSDVATTEALRQRPVRTLPEARGIQRDENKAYRVGFVNLFIINLFSEAKSS